MKFEHEIQAFHAAYGSLRGKRGGKFKYPEGARMDAIAIVDAGLILGHSQSDTCAKLGLGKSTIYVWRRMVKRNKPKTREDKPVEAKGNGAVQDTNELPEARKDCTGEVRVELTWGLVVTGKPDDVWEFLKIGCIPKK